MPKIENTQLNPMDDYVNLNIYEGDEDIFNQNWFDPAKSGKWLLFYPPEDMDQKWQQALSLYHAKVLTGIQSMKCSTAAPNPRAGNKKEGAIRFVCGPYDDEALVLSYGKNLIAKMEYKDNYGFIAYKTDEQSELGTAATGAKRNYLYRLEVREVSTFTERNPPPVSDEVTFYRLPKITSKFPNYPDKPSAFGMWIMSFENNLINLSWERACTLYAEEELLGIMSLKMPACNPRLTGRAIVFMCEIPSSVESWKNFRRYGRNLVDKMEYVSRETLKFKTMTNRDEYSVTFYELEVPSSKNANGIS